MNGTPPLPAPTGPDHLAALAGPLAALGTQADRLAGWGRHLAGVLLGGGRLLTCGNGGSAAQAQHLSSELVGRYRDERQPFSAIALCADSSSVTAVANDYGVAELFARQVRAHGRAGDVLVVLSTSGTSANAVAAAEAAQEAGLVVWGLTGPAPNPLLEHCHDAVVVDAPAVATVQEIHQVVVHLLCSEVEQALALPSRTGVEKSSPQPLVDPGTEGRRGGRTRGREIVVVGDAMLDRDLEGTVERVCPDAPVPVVDARQERCRPGGAALAASLAAADGAAVTLVTALADDEAGRTLRRLLAEAGVAVVDLGLLGTTPEKIRVRAGGQSLLRIDQGGPPGAVGPLSSAAWTALERADAILVADYGRGLAEASDVRTALARLLPRTPLVWDPHPRGPEPLAGARLTTPNHHEAARLVPAVEGGPGIVLEAERARHLAARWRAGGVAITLGERGALLAGPDGPPLVVPPPVPAAGDACGAGDRFSAAAAVALASGALVSEAVEQAVLAASTFVAAGGAQSVAPSPDTGAGGEPPGSPSPVLASNSHLQDDPLSQERVGTGEQATAPAREVVARTRRAGGTVVATGGCFDLLHAGHVHMLQAARRLGDCLVVLLNSDDSVRRLKGPDRPLQSQDDRAAVLAGLDCVDAVAVFDEDTPVAALERLRPDLFAKGADYAVADLPEARTLSRWGGEAVVLPYLQGRSTTRLIEEALRHAP